MHCMNDIARRPGSHISGLKSGARSSRREFVMRAICRFSRYVIALLLVLFLTEATTALVLVDSGQSAYTIVVREGASPSEKHAAEELQHHLQLISGAFIPVRNAGESITGPIILIGKSAAYQDLTADVSLDILGSEGFVIKTSGDNLVLAGGQQRGSMYAVYTFLEDVLGCRWYTSDCARIPRKPTLEIPALNETQKPAFEYREPFWFDAFDRDWAARNKVNSSSARLDLQRGGKADWPGVHTFYPLMPPDTYFDDHPEWYSILANRKREWEYGQLCLANPETQRVMVHRVLRQMADNPGRSIFSVSQNDWHVACDCPHCRRIDTEEGSHSGSLVYFVNAVADRTRDEFPDKRIMTLAYTYTEKPPRNARPADNVIIRLCNMNHITGCDAHPLEQCDRNAVYVENLKGWSKIAKTIYIWDYVTNFANYLQPFPIWNTNKADLLFYRNHGVDGVFEQGCYTTPNGGCSEIMAYIEAKLLWNPDADVDAIVDDFIRGYYGPAAAPMKELYSYMNDRVMKDWCHFTLYSPTNIDMLSPAFLSKSTELLEAAEQAALGNPEALFRVESARLWFDYVKLAQPIPRIMDGKVYRIAPSAPGFANLRNLDEFIRTCRAHGVEDLSEGRKYYRRERQMRANLSSHQVVTLENEFLKVDVLPTIGGRIHQITDKQTGKQVLRAASESESSFPMAGGIGESPMDAERCTHVLEDTPEGKKLTMQATVYYRSTGDAMVHIREIILPKGRAEIQFNSHVESLIDIHYPVRISPSIDLSIGGSDDVIAGFAAEDGTFDLSGLRYESDEWNRYARRFRARELVSGRMALANEAQGVALLVEFNPAEVEVCSVSGDESIILGISGAQKPLRPGDTLGLSYRLKLVKPEELAR